MLAYGWLIPQFDSLSTSSSRGSIVSLHWPKMSVHSIQPCLQIGANCPCPVLYQSSLTTDSGGGLVLYTCDLLAYLKTYRSWYAN